MSGWDASARPSWDPQGGDGENTQAFSAAPDFPEAAGDPWPEPAAPRPESGYRGRHQDPDSAGSQPSRYRSDGFGTGAMPAGPPPDIFQQDYGQRDFPQRDFPQPGAGQHDRAGNGYRGETFGQDDADNGLPRRGQQEYFSLDRARQDQARPDDGRYGAQRDFTSKDHVGKDDAWWDQPADRDPLTDRDQLADRDPLADRDRLGHRDPLTDRSPLTDRDWPADRDRPAAGRDAARMDPALADFFAPQPPRAGAGRPGQPGPGQQRGDRGYPGEDPGQDRGPRPTRPNGVGPGAPGQARGPAQASYTARPGAGPARSGRSAQPDERGPALNGPFSAGQRAMWDGPAMSPPSRSARRQSRRPPRRGVVTIGVTVGLAAAIGIAIVAVLLTRKPATTTAGAQSTPTAGAAQPTASAGAKSAGASTQPAAKPAGYTLATPATAGGYTRLAAAPAAVKDVAATTAQGVRQHAVQVGGKITGQVTGYYQLSGGQVMSFTGYRGTFDPAKVLAGSGGQAFPAGPHGGGLVCTPSAGIPGGTVCVWVTGTTLGITEFFGSTGSPETVAKQSKAAADTVNLRSGVEQAKS